MTDGFEKPFDRTSKPTDLAPVFSHKAKGGKAPTSELVN